MGKNFYQILGISKTATETDIRKAYRKLALKYHPDRNKEKGAEEKFKEISYAYEILSDSDKKKKYDQFGEAGINPSAAGPSSGPSGTHQFNFTQFGNMGGGSHGMHDFTHFFNQTPGGVPGRDSRGSFDFDTFDPFSTFSSAFGKDFNIFTDMGQQSSQQPNFSNMSMPGGPTINMNLNGGPQGRRQGNKKSNGNLDGKITGITPSIEHDVNLTLEELFHGIIKKYNIGRDKRQPNGSYRRDQKLFEVNVKPGWKDNTKIRFTGEANESDNKLAGDIIFIIKTKPHDYFERDNEHLIYHQPISLKDALLGKQKDFNIPMLTGETKKISINNEIINPNTTKTLVGHGLPISKLNNGTRGNLIVKFKIIFPDRVSENTKGAAHCLGGGRINYDDMMD